MACHGKRTRPPCGRPRGCRRLTHRRPRAGISGGERVFDAGDRPVSAHKSDHAPKPWRARSPGSARCVETAIAQRAEHRSNRVHTAHGQLSRNQRLGHPYLPGSLKRNLRKSDRVARPSTQGGPHSRCPPPLSLLHPTNQATNTTSGSRHSPMACRPVASARRREPVSHDLVRINKIGRRGRSRPVLTGFSGALAPS
jgi:hypothetical protein